MKKAFLFICIFLFFRSVKSQDIATGLVKALEEISFVPVEFKNFGEWISSIENDSSIRFEKKHFTIENYSPDLNSDIKNPTFISPFNDSRLSVLILGNTREFNNLSTLKTTHNSLAVVPLPSKKVTTIQLFTILTFDSANEDKRLAEQAQKSLEEKFAVFFAKKMNYKGKRYTPKKNPNVVRGIGFINKKE